MSYLGNWMSMPKHKQIRGPAKRNDDLNEEAKILTIILKVKSMPKAK